MPGLPLRNQGMLSSLRGTAGIQRPAHSYRATSSAEDTAQRQKCCTTHSLSLSDRLAGAAALLELFIEFSAAIERTQSAAERGHPYLAPRRANRVGDIPT